MGVRILWRHHQARIVIINGNIDVLASDRVIVAMGHVMLGQYLSRIVFRAAKVIEVSENLFVFVLKEAWADPNGIYWYLLLLNV